MEQGHAFYAKKKVLVTGGAGFIGSHLVEKLVAYGAQVTVLDNFSTGNLGNLKSVISSVNLLYADVRSSYGCLKAATHQEMVFHLASFVSVPESIKHPELCSNINVNGTRNLLEACVKNNVKTFIFSSSSAIYGNKEGICSEDDTPNPQSPYAYSKWEAENLVREYTKQFGLQSAMLRYFNVHGPRQNPNGQYAAVVARFTNQLMNNQPLIIFGDGTQTRDFVPVASVVEANLTVARQPTLNAEVLNIGSGTSINLLQLVEQLEKQLNVSRVDVQFEPARQGDIHHSQARCEKYQKFVQAQ
jgi:UDP-glucose 4-epimerase